jgi:hypothetical protein
VWGREHAASCHGWWGVVPGSLGGDLWRSTSSRLLNILYHASKINGAPSRPGLLRPAGRRGAARRLHCSWAGDTGGLGRLGLLMGWSQISILGCLWNGLPFLGFHAWVQTHLTFHTKAKRERVRSSAARAAANQLDGECPPYSIRPTFAAGSSVPTPTAKPELQIPTVRGFGSPTSASAVSFGCKNNTM